MARLDRRGFFKLSAALAGGAALGGLALPASPVAAAGDYGPLTPTPAENDGVTYLALPEGFRYVVFGAAGSLMSDGTITPGAHDGMGAFALPNGHIRLIRNHELRSAATPLGDPAKAYDGKAAGGTTSLEWDPTTRRLVASFVSLSGTVRNCAGGVTPWGTWLSCEETTDGPAQGYTKPHGYVFEVPASATGQVTAQPLTALGRAAWEAAVVSPETGDIYLTEDRRPSGLYRFVPKKQPAGSGKGRLAEGVLQMLRIRGPKPFDQYDTYTGEIVGKTLWVDWVTIDDPTGNLFAQGWARGGARFNRLEGAWYHQGHIYFDATSGGDAGLGQIWKLNPTWKTLELIYESPDLNALENPDNLTVTPKGNLLICEDGPGQDYLRGLYRDGQTWKIFPFARNELNTAELAGACFSPDGKYLFVNIYSPGYTFAIWGPWERGAL